MDYSQGDGEKQRITNLASLSKLMAEQVLRVITERHILLRATTDKKLSHD